MSFESIGGVLHAEKVPLPQIAARFGTPCFVYSRAALTAALQEFQSALDGCDALVCYAAKANSNLAILNLFARMGAGFDIVSVGELERALAADADPAKIIFSGVGKRADEIERALQVGIGCFNVESEAELQRIDAIAARAGYQAPISLRVNPDVDPKTHPYISTGLKENKFGVDWQSARAIYRRASKMAGLRIVGIDCHIGSQILDIEPFADALDRILELVDQLADDGIPLAHVDLGGGLGIRYRDEDPPSIAAYLGAIRQQLAQRGLKLVLEPGRRLVGNAGLLLTKIEYLKPAPAHNFAIVDAAMNDLVRPALYDAWHDVRPVIARQGPAMPYDIVGPICESGDFLAKGRLLSVAADDLLAIMSAGAYGMTMSSNYNTRPRAAEVMVDGGTAHLIRRRETIADLIAPESLLPR
jgi:diaminopimelate decarboxylase